MAGKTENQKCKVPLWMYLIIILFTGLSLRIAYFNEIKKEPWFNCPLYDPLYNHYWAKGIATGDWDLPAPVNDPEIRFTPHGRPPGYPYILAIIYLIFGVNPISPRVVQYFFGLLNIFILSWILKKHLNNNLALILASLSFATYWGLIYFESILTYPTFVVFLLLIWFALILKWEEDSNSIYLSTSALLLGMILLFRPNAILLISLYIILTVRKYDRNLRKILTSLILLLFFTSIPLIPCFIRNYLVSKDFVFISSYGGLNFYVGNHPKSDGAEPRIPELKKWIGTSEWSCFDYPAIVRGLAKDLGKEKISFSEANRYFYKKAILNIISNPKTWTKLTLKKILLFWGPVEITNDTVPQVDKQYSKILSTLPGFSTYSSIFLASLIYILYLLIFQKTAYRTIPSVIKISISIVVIYFLSVLPFFIAGRYRIPIIPFMLIVDGWFISEFWRNLQQKKISIFIFQVILIFLSAFVTNTNFTGYQPSESIWYYRQGTSALLCNDYNRALNEFKKSLKSDPQNLFAKINYATTLAKVGRPTEGIYVLTNNFKDQLKTSEELNTLGYLFEQIGDLEKAQEFYAKAIVNSPNFTLAHSNLSRIFTKRNEYNKARKHFQIVVSQQPYNFYAHFQLAKICETLSDYESALDHYKTCVEIKPSSEVSWNNIGWIYEKLGDYNSAMEAYNKAIQIDPNYLLSWINLVNLYLKLNELQKAEILAQNLLVKFPHNCEVSLLLSNTYLLEGKIREANNTLLNELPFCDDDPRILNNLGTIRWRYYDDPNALTMWLNSMILDPTIVEVYVNLADFFEAQNNCKLAIEYLITGLYHTENLKIKSTLNGYLCDKN